MSIKSILSELKEADYSADAHLYLDQLTNILDDLVQDPDSMILPSKEVKALRGFRLTLHRAKTMTPSMIQKHVTAYWEHAKKPVLKMKIGNKVADIVDKLASLVIPHNEG